MTTILQDLRHGLRMFARAPGFTFVAVLTVGLGIGASTVVFSLVDAVLIRSLPYRDANRIVIPMRQTPPGINLGYNDVPWGVPDAYYLSHQVRSYESTGAFKSDEFNLTGHGDPVRVDGLRASAGFFRTLGINPALGRVYTADEDQPGHEHEVVLGYSLWQGKFGGDPGVLGRAAQLNGASYTVVGVMPEGFSFPRGEELPASFNFPRTADLWVPLAIPPARVHPDDPDELAVIARLTPGASVDQAQAEMNIFAKRQEDLDPRAKNWYNSHVISLPRQVAGDTRQPLLLLLGSVGVVLLIACANVANLMLARSLGRVREITLRTALGAARSRILRQLLTESVLLSFLGGVLGVALGEGAIALVKAYGPINIPRLHEVNFDLGVLAFAAGITVLSGILFGLAPAIGATKQNLVEALKEGGQRTGGGPVRQTTRSALLISEVALALVLVVAAGLLIRTFSHLLRTDPGFDAASVLTLELTLPGDKYSDNGRLVRAYTGILDNIRARPGVRAAGLTATVPMAGSTNSTWIRIPGRAPASQKVRLFAAYTVASPGYFPAVGTPILRGRDFLNQDNAGSPPVTIVNEAMAKKFWPGEDPIGKAVGPRSLRYATMTIIGVAADVKRLSMKETPGPEMYVLYSQKPWPSMLTMDVVVRASGDPRALAGSLSGAVHRIDPDLPVAKVATLRTLVDDTMAQPRFSMLLMVMFGALALMLASVGIYGVVSFGVAQRTREIGIRMALGAERGEVFGMILRQGARLAGWGVVVGLAVAFAVTRLMRALLYGVEPFDPLTFVAVPVLLIAIALVACYVPARRAMRVDPMVALRDE